MTENQRQFENNAYHSKINLLNAEKVVANVPQNVATTQLFTSNPPIIDSFSKQLNVASEPTSEVKNLQTPSQSLQSQQQIEHGSSDPNVNAIQASNIIETTTSTIVTAIKEPINNINISTTANAQSSAITSKNLVPELIPPHPYITNTLKSSILSIEKIENELKTITLSSPVIQNYYDTITSQLQYLSKQIYTQSSSSNTNNDSNETIYTNDEIFSNLCEIIRETNKAINLSAQDTDPKQFLRFLLLLFNSIIHQVIYMKHIYNETTTETRTYELINDELVLMYSTFIYGVFRQITPNLKGQLSLLFRGILLRETPICLPSLSIINNTLTSSSLTFNNQQKNGLVLYASLGIQKAAHPLNTDFTWKWFLILISEFEFLMKTINTCATTTNNNTNIKLLFEKELIKCSQNKIATYIQSVIRFAGFYLLSVYTNQYLSLLQKLCTVITDILKIMKSDTIQQVINQQNQDTNNNNTININTIINPWTELYSYLQIILKSKLISSQCFQKNTPHVIECLFMKHQIDDIRKMSINIDQEDKSAGQKIRFCVGKAFNRLDITPESASLVVDSLLEYISNAGSDEMALGYTLNKMASLLIDRTRTISINTEGHTLKLARVACELCIRQPQLKDLVRSQFYYTCPLIFPRFPVDNTNNNSNNTNNTKTDNNDAEILNDVYKQDFGYTIKTLTKDKSNINTTNNNHNNANTEEEDTLVWETNEDWLDRMGKILGVFAEIVGINKETPFSIEDGWIWLVNIVNLGKCVYKYIDVINI